MEQSSSRSIITKVGIAVLVIALIDLLYLNYWVVNISQDDFASRELREVQSQFEPSPTPLTEPISIPTPIEKIIETQTIIEKEIQTVVQNAQKEIFIPLGSGSIADNDWTSIPGLEVEIDTSKYTGIESIRFEATLWPEGGNGKAYARVYNVTDNNPYIESVISSSSSVGTYHNSGSIPFPNSSKTYGVQVKSDIENFAAHLENARIKITLK